MDDITLFRGKYGFLSAMHDCTIKIGDRVFGNAEAAYQAGRALYTDDIDSFQNMGGVEAKKRGKEIKRSKYLQRPDWYNIQEDRMYTVQYAKYSQNEDLRRKLLDTGDALLIEGNDWGDTFWGVCDGVGSNKAGKVLMRVREELRTGAKHLNSEFKSIMDIDI